MIETRRLKNVIFFQTILSFVLSRKIINKLCMACLYSQGDFAFLQHFRLFLLNEYDVYKFLRIQLKALILISQ